MTKFQGLQDSQNLFTRTFQDIFGSQTWPHEVQKMHIPNQLSMYLHYSKQQRQYTQSFYCSSGICPGYPGEQVPERYNQEG